MRAVTTPLPGCQFDRFLYASVGEDTNGMPLTVLSALARMNVDPWEEASKLTQLPPASAITQLAGLLGALRTAPAAVSILLTVVTYAVFMLLGQWLMGSLTPPGQTPPPAGSATAIDAPHAPTSGAARPEPVK